MMCKKSSNEIFISKVKKSLEPLGRISCIALDNKILGLYKDEIMFGFIKDTALYLRANEENLEIFTECHNFQGNKYCKLRFRFPLNSDSFIQAATQSYWIASG